MAIHHKELRSEREWKSTIGLSKIEFEKISLEFGKIYEELKGYSISPENSRYDLLFKTYADCVFFVSFQLKQGDMLENTLIHNENKLFLSLKFLDKL